MKRIICSLIVSVLMLTSCSNIQKGKMEQVCSYADDGKTLIDMQMLNGEEYAYLYASDNKYTVRSALQNGENDKVLYETTGNAYINEIYANDGIIAFFERILYSNNDERCTLKVIDTQTQSVYTPYEKVIVYSKADIQSRFIVIQDKSVYYITTSFVLNRSRVMKYTVGDKEPTELTSVDLTENELTYNHSVTSLSGSGGKLVLTCLDGYTNYLALVNTQTGECEKKKILSEDIGVVYSTSYDSSSGSIVMYYSTFDEEGVYLSESIGSTSFTSDEIKPLYNIEKNEDVIFESVTLNDGYAVFGIQSKDDGDNITNTSYIFDISNGKGISYSNGFDAWIENDVLYVLHLEDGITSLNKTNISK